MARVITETIEETIKRRTTFIRRMERRYETSSHEMNQRVKDGKNKRTPEVGRWLMTWKNVKDLTEKYAKDSKT